MLIKVETKDARAVEEYVEEVYHRLFPGGNSGFSQTSV